MAGGKETPRQKMINLMYLVLTAMLALNVSDSVLNAFKLVREGLETTNNNFSDKNDVTYSLFEKQVKARPEKVKPYYVKAMAAKKISDDLKGYIEDIKKELIKKGEGLDPKTGDIVRRDDQDASTRLMMGEGNNGKAKELKAKIVKARQDFLNLVDPKERVLIEKSLSLNAVDPKGLGENGVPQTWENENFEGVPLTAVVTLLTKMQADVENSEASVVDHLYKSIDADVTIAVDQFKAVAVAPTSYLIEGQPYKAQVFLTAFDSHENPDVTVNGSKLAVKDGMGDYSVNTSKQGIFTWVGVIHIKDKDGKDKEYKTDPQTYQVSAPSAVVSADKMNVLYVGVPNPVSVSAPGIQLDKVHASISGGGSSISGSNGHYIAKVSEPGKATFTVSGEVDGKQRVLGTTEYRIKRIPDPIAKFGGIGSGRLSAGAIKAQAGVAAVLEGFDFDAHFEVVKFTMSVNKARQLDLFTDVSNSASLTPSMKNALQGISPRDRISIDDIMVKGPDGVTRKLTNGITITAN